VLADIGGQARRHLLLAADLDRAVDGHVFGIGEADEMPGRERLLVGRDISCLGDDAEDQPGLVEHAAPMGEVPRRENAVEVAHQRAGVFLARSDAAIARVVERRVGETRFELVPAPFVRRDRQQKPASVAAAVVHAQCVDRLLARRLRRHGVAAQRRLHRAAIGPEPVCEQRRADVVALAGALALVQGRDDRAVGAHRRGVIAHARQ
jgi:hypothetical protein